MPAALYLSGPCKICGQPANGNHFGVMSCRACASFFRRAASRSSRFLDLKCGNDNCVIFQNGKYKCKKCRLKKCYEAGMDSSKFQNNHDLMSSTTSLQKTSPPQSLANFLGRPEFILCCEPDRGTRIKTRIDVSHLIDKAIQIFEVEPTDYCTPWKFENSLDKLTISVENMKIRREANLEIKKIRFIGVNENMLFWEKTFLSAARWFSEIPEFAELDTCIKLEIVKSAWMVWARLDKIAESVDRHRKKVLESNVFMWTDDMCMDLNDVAIDFKWCTNYTMDQLKAFLEPDVNHHWKDSMEDVMKLEPTKTELNFMLIQLCLNEAGKRNQGQILEITDRLLQIQADNLHEYYTKTMKMPHYSSRLAQLMKVNKRIELDVRERKERNYLSDVFNLYSVEYSHPEMFVAA
uniref:Nuclear Hormone Receptor family n=2 Tax=Caenorhabditis tropicalis TaxID=1561998 RepID=A0A1I7TAT3_9PELO